MKYKVSKLKCVLPISSMSSMTYFYIVIHFARLTKMLAMSLTMSAVGTSLSLATVFRACLGPIPGPKTYVYQLPTDILQLGICHFCSCMVRPRLTNTSPWQRCYG